MKICEPIGVSLPSGGSADLSATFGDRVERADAPKAASTPMVLSDDQQRAYDAALSGRNVFVTGPGGVGKSEVVNQIIEGLRAKGKNVYVTGSTGVAAVRVGGSTIHSYLGTRLAYSKDSLRASFARDSTPNLSNVAARFGRTDVLVLDEVSMLTGDYLDMMDWWIKRHRASTKPFGGIQMIFSGDFLQLPPVIKRGGEIEHRFAFECAPWMKADLDVIHMETCFRQSDSEFLDHLLQLRRGVVSPAAKKYFAARVGVELDEPTRLYSTNDKVFTVNQSHLSALPGKAKTYEGMVDGNEDYLERFIKSCIVDFEIDLKVGAPVLFLRNGYEDGALVYVNGQRGVVVEMHVDHVLVESNGRTFEVRPVAWEYKDADQKVLCTMYQVPLKLAWAVTIHKSQGMTMDCLECDVSSCFEDGQVYVALSRVKTIEGLSLTTGIDSRIVKAAKDAVAYYDSVEA